MRGPKITAGPGWVSIGRAFVQNLRRGHYELGLDVPPKRRLAKTSPSSPS